MIWLWDPHPQDTTHSPTPHLVLWVFVPLHKLMDPILLISRLLIHTPSYPLEAQMVLLILVILLPTSFSHFSQEIEGWKVRPNVKSYPLKLQTKQNIVQILSVLRNTEQENILDTCSLVTFTFRRQPATSLLEIYGPSGWEKCHPFKLLWIEYSNWIMY